jgi:uncharacterized integral membrane protein
VTAVAEPELQGQRQETNWKRWALGFAVLILAIFIAQNSQEVEVDFLFVETTTPLIFALLIATALGALIGWLGPRLRRDRD